MPRPGPLLDELGVSKNTCLLHEWEIVMVMAGAITKTIPRVERDIPVPVQLEDWTQVPPAVLPDGSTPGVG